MKITKSEDVPETSQPSIPGTVTAGAVVRTLLLTDLVNSTKLVEELGDYHAMEISERHDHEARALLARHGGLEIDKTDGFLLLFRRPIDAVNYALAYHQLLEELSRELGAELRARAGIHLGEVFLRRNDPQEIARGAKPIEVEGLAKPTAARVMSLAGSRQTLMTRGAFDLSRRAAVDQSTPGHELEWISHGRYTFKGVAEPVEVCEVGRPDLAPLTAPADSEKARRALTETSIETAGAIPGTIGTRLASRKAVIVLAVAVLALLALAAAFLARRFDPFSGDTVSARPSVAVLGFRNMSGKPEVAWLSTALAEMLSTELAGGEILRIISGETVGRMKIELALAEAETLAMDTLALVGRNLGTDYVVLGSYLVLGSGPDPTIRLDYRLQDTVSGETLASASSTGTEAALFDIVSQVGGDLRGQLGAGELSAFDAEAAHASLSASPEAIRLYSEGLAKLRLYDALAAREVLEQAVTVDPEFALAHVALSQAWSGLGYDRKAEESARQAFDLAAGLPREKVLLIEGRYHEASKEWQQAVDTYSALWQFFPDNVDYGLRLAEAQVAAGQGRDALVTVESLHRLPHPQGNDARIDLAEASAAGSLADSERQLTAGRRAQRKGHEQRATILVARALSRHQGWALQLLGRASEATEALEEAERLYTEAGILLEVAITLSIQANILSEAGEYSRAEEIYRRSLLILLETGSKKWVATLQNNLALTLAEKMGRLAEARALIDKAIAASREVGSRWDEESYLDTKALILIAQGDLEAAAALTQTALAISDEIGERSGLAYGYLRQGQIALARGQLKAARDGYDQLLEESEQIGLKHLAGHAYYGLGEILVATDDLPGAEQMFERSELIRTELGQKGGIAEVQVARVRLLVALGRPAEAEEQARTARQTFEEIESPDGEITAAAVLVTALRAQGRLTEARATLDRYRALAAASEAVQVRLFAAVAEARLLGAEREFGAAVRRLDAVVEQASESSLLGLELEARFALGELEAVSGEVGRTGGGSGRIRLDAVAEAAAKQGFELIARKARAAVKEPGSA